MPRSKSRDRCRQKEASSKARGAPRKIISAKTLIDIVALIGNGVAIIEFWSRYHSPISAYLTGT